MTDAQPQRYHSVPIRPTQPAVVPPPLPNGAEPPWVDSPRYASALPYRAPGRHPWRWALLLLGAFALGALVAGVVVRGWL